MKQPERKSVNQYKQDLKLPHSLAISSKIFAFKLKLNSDEALPLKYVSDSLINSTEYSIIQNVDSIVYYKDAALVFDSSEQVRGLYEYEPGLTKFLNIQKVNRDSTIDSKIGSLKIKAANFIKLDVERKIIIDNLDTMQIVDHWPKYKFIFVDANNSTNPLLRKTPFSHFNTIIYSYK